MALEEFNESEPPNSTIDIYEGDYHSVAELRAYLELGGISYGDEFGYWTVWKKPTGFKGKYMRRMHCYAQFVDMDIDKTVEIVQRWLVGDIDAEAYNGD